MAASLQPAAQPVLSGRHVRLRTLMPSDYEYLYRLATDEEIAWRWRYRGHTPSPEQFQQNLFAGITAQFIVEHLPTGKPIGHVQAFDANDRNESCHFSILLDPSLDRVGWTMEALLLFLDYLFTVFNFRKLYAEVPEFNFRKLYAGAQRYAKIEGRLREHEWHAGRYWDLYFVAVYRDDWAEQWHPRVEQLASERAEAGMAAPRSSLLAEAPTSLHAFCKYLSDQLGIELLDPDADIRTDLGLESIQMFALLIAVEDLGVTVPDELMPHILTLRDAYAHYESSLGHRP